ncbi:cysteine hydrolase family protein [Brevibacillus laterosporus]|uniref:Cysteine hydrolase family protein n=1 Tax=Brevibacillus laterosporus TaxID=1465 RepID=A0AAP3DCI4_BRELA|nr:cysteine hydrolase family protein [Brevibacillus laterosporus]MCR8978395.1 cysteine hydrolase [Brevibacillus laterosporus]MCZ0805551.1 cysteine hydrolase family protein [Brevibacillus laterosporus]MCZ0825273.1 cysteine hydrolase family protein [Brevibacillus laterosporus]MCZ0849049.1 cysteine hydrolase family protein [Brevibacillus laterosporus]MED1663383.1 cysteine hydrolase family protein [Brevibacillus laterosporus]
MNQTLLIIDAQQELIDGNQEESAVFNKEQLIRNINKVIEKARESDVPVVFVRDLDVAEGKGGGFQVHNEIHVPTEAKFFDKSATNSFYGTGLLNHLRSQQIKHIVVMGCKTQHCIDSVVRTATISGLDVTLVGDGHSTTDNDVLSAEQIIKHHNSTLHGHYNVEHFSVVRNVEEDLFRPTHDSYR